MKSLCISTAFFHVEGHAPNLGKASYAKKLEAYYKCMVVFFASARRFHPQAKLALFSNETLPELYTQLLNKFEVKQISVPEKYIKYADNPNLKNNFPGCLFLLDVINFCAHENILTDSSSLIIFDSDSIFMDSLDEAMLNALSNNGIIGTTLDRENNEVENGQTRCSLSLLLVAMKGFTPSEIIMPYYGGGFYGMATSILSQISSDIDSCIQYIIDHNTVWGKHFTEEHILSIVYAVNKESIIEDNKNTKRVWTADTYQNIDGNEKDYKLLHYPAEKKAFFKKIFGYLSENPRYFDNMNIEEMRNIALSPVYLRLHPPFVKKVKIIVKSSLKALAKKYA